MGTPKSVSHIWNQPLLFVERHQIIAHWFDFETLLLTTLTAKTYTTQHDGEFFIFGFILLHSSLVGLLRHSLKDGLGTLCCMRAAMANAQDSMEEPRENHFWTRDTLVTEQKMQRPSKQQNQRARLNPSHVSDSHSTLLPELPNAHKLIVETRADNRPLPSFLPTLNRLHVTSIVHAPVLFELRQHAESPLARALSRASRRFEPHDPRPGVHAARQQRV